MNLKRTVVRSMGLGVGILAVVGLVRAQEDRPSGLQITPDEVRTLISKDVGAERWAITRNLDDNTVTGNVFFPTGDAPLFLYCTQTGMADGNLTLDCSSADLCAGAPCGGDQWSFLSSVTLPESFFLPTSSDQVVAEAFAPAAEDLAAAAAALESPAQGSLPAGLQVTPDDKRTLLSKDVGGERWAITRNLDDNTVTGNVFFPSGGDPIFIYCEQTAVDGSNLMFDCSSADRCPVAPCPGDQWAFLAPVTLPESFFLPDGDAPPMPTPRPTVTTVPTATPGATPTPTPGGGEEFCGNGVVDGDEECDGEDIDGEECDFLVGGSDECTGTVRCNSDCTFDVSACTCPCDGDLDCDWEIDCEAVVPGCDELLGACNGSTCITQRAGTDAICNGLDPEEDDPDFTRCF